MIVYPADDLFLDIFVDSIFDQLCGNEDDKHPSYVKGYTSFVITLSGTPVLLVYMMQIDRYFITMGKFYVALSHSIIELLTLCWLVEKFSGNF